MSTQCQVYITQSAQIKPSFKMPVNKSGGIWQRLGLDKSITPNPPAPPAPPVSFLHTKGPQALLWRQHCSSTLLANTESTVKLKHTIQKATDAGAVGSEDYAQAGDGSTTNKNLAADFQKKNKLATKRADFPIPLHCHLGHN